MGFMKMDDMEDYLQDHIRERNKQNKAFQKKSKSRLSQLLYSQTRKSGRTPFHIAFPTILCLVLGTTYLIGRTLSVELEDEVETKIKRKEMGDMRTFYGRVGDSDASEADAQSRMEILEQRWKSFENKRVPRPDEDDE